MKPQEKCNLQRKIPLTLANKENAIIVIHQCMEKNCLDL